MFRLAWCHHFGHGYARIEIQLIGRVLPAHLAECLVGSVTMSQLRLQLSEEIPFTGPLLASHLMLDDLAEIRYGTLVLPSVDIVVGISVVPFFLGVPVDGVAAHVADNVLGIIEPFLFDIAFGKPGPCLAIDGGLGLVEAAHV